MQPWHISTQKRKQNSDASPLGLSAILFQKTPRGNDRKVVVYVSRALSDVETRVCVMSDGMVGVCVMSDGMTGVCVIGIHKRRE